MIFLFVFFFKQKTAYEMRISDWSSDVCSSDLFLVHQPRQRLGKLRVRIVGSGPALGLDEQRPARPHATQRVVQPRRRGDQLALRRADEVRPTKTGRALETDRKSVGEGKRGEGSGNHGGRRIIKKKKNKTNKKK